MMREHKLFFSATLEVSTCNWEYPNIDIRLNTIVAPLIINIGKVTKSFWLLVDAQSSPLDNLYHHSNVQKPTHWIETKNMLLLSSTIILFIGISGCNCFHVSWYSKFFQSFKILHEEKCSLHFLDDNCLCPLWVL